MRKSTITITLVTLVTTILSACGTAEPTTEVPKEPIAKTIEIFTVGKDQPTLNFTKSGQIESGTVAFVMPQTSGLITDILVQVGDKVRKNQLLVTLGDSITTDSASLNYQSAQEGLQKLYDLKFKTDYAAQKDIDATMVSYYSAMDGLKSAIQSRDHARDLYEEQHDLLEDTVNKDDPTYKQTKSQLEQMEIGNEAQEDQLELAIETAKARLESSILAVEGVQAKYSLQFIQLDSNILQAETGSDLARLQKEARNVKAPIEGVVTQIQGEEGNFASPGQLILTVENIDELNVKTYLSIDEIALIDRGDLVSAVSSTSSTTGIVTQLSPTLSSNGKAEVEITLSDDTNLISGEIVEITFTPNLKTTSTLVPLNSLIIEDDQYFVNTVSQNKTITRKEVVIGSVLGNYVEISSGLNFGDKVALSTSFLREGDKVAYKIKRSVKTPQS